MKKLTSCILVILGITGLCLAGSEVDGSFEYQVIANTSGMLLFGVSCLLGSLHARNKLHPLRWLLYPFRWLKYKFDYYYNDLFFFWRL